MSTIQSSAEHLTLNADGSSKDIKFQANGVEKASISSAGAFTSTTIDATKLTGTIPNFTSTGIDDNADATAMTITSDEKIGIGTASPNDLFHVVGNAVTGAHYDTSANTIFEQNENVVQIVATDGGGNAGAIVLTNTPTAGSGTNKHWVVHHSGVSTNDQFEIGYTTSTATDFDGRSATPLFAITTDGRGLSQFTAKAWVNFNGSGTLAVNDSHNVSSVSDANTGHYVIYFSNAMANSNYCFSGMAGDDSGAETTIQNGGATPATTYHYIQLKNAAGTVTDRPMVCVTYFGD